MHILPGVYEHYKGKTYRVHFVAHHSETLEQLVVYEALYDVGDGLGQYFVRPLMEFVEDIYTQEGTIPRFKRLS